MNALEDLTKQALLGIGKRGLAWPVADGELGLFLQELASLSGEPAQQLLRAAGSLALCGQAGYQPSPLASPFLAPAAESLPAVQQPQQINILREVFDSEAWLLKREALRVLAKHQHLLPRCLLPRVLSMPKLWDLLPAVLGNSGYWLAAQHPDWRAIADSQVPLKEEDWEYGSTERRVAYLQQVRSLDAEHGRNLLAQSLSGLDAKERLLFLESLQIGLSNADEAFLESLLRDRSREVRRRVADLLMQLPQSRYVERMQERLEACLSQGGTLQIEPPQSFAEEWKGDGLEAAPPKHSNLGERAWWLQQIASRVPLTWWQSRTGKKPAELLAWLNESEWSTALLNAWLNALQIQADGQWIKALLALLPKQHVEVQCHNTYLNGPHWLARLPLQEASPYWEYWFDEACQEDSKLDRSDLLRAFREALPVDCNSLPLCLSEKLMKLCKLAYWYTPSIGELACLMHPTALQKPQNAKQWNNTTLEEVLNILSLRQRLQHLFD